MQQQELVLSYLTLTSMASQNFQKCVFSWMSFRVLVFEGWCCLGFFISHCQPSLDEIELGLSLAILKWRLRNNKILCEWLNKIRIFDISISGLIYKQCRKVNIYKPTALRPRECLGFYKSVGILCTQNTRDGTIRKILIEYVFLIK